MKKVLQISKYMYPYIGGTEQVARDILNALSGEAYEQKIICFNEDAADGGYVCHRRETVHDAVDGAEIVRCGCVGRIASQSLSFTYGQELKKLMDGFRPDIVVFHYPNPFAAHYLLKYKKRDFKLLIYWHLDITKQKFLKKLFYRQNLALIGRADRILGATPKHVNESAFTSRFGEKKVVLPYAVDENRLAIPGEEIVRAEEIRERYAGKTLCFFVGRHVPYKGLEYLIEAARYVRGNEHFLIAGSGELTERLKQEAAGAENVEFIGRISDPEWRSYLKACDIFCFPSITRNEGFGLALAEGMYYGKPAVTFTIPGSGVNDVCPDGVTGIECPNRDSVSYAAALDKLAGDAELRERCGAAARERVLEKFTFDQFRKNVLQIFENA